MALCALTTRLRLSLSIFHSNTLSGDHFTDTGASFVGGVLALAVAVVVFLIFRAAALWYRRISQGITLLKSIDEKLGAR
jgi:hypothetical protein